MADHDLAAHDLAAHDLAAHDLAALWEEHCRHEFETRDLDATMASMVAEPYVNHVPTMTGGVGHDALGASTATTSSAGTLRTPSSSPSAAPWARTAWWTR